MARTTDCNTPRTSPLAVIAVIALALVCCTLVLAPVLGWVDMGVTPDGRVDELRVRLDRLEDRVDKTEDVLRQLDDEVYQIKRRLKIGQVGAAAGE